MRHALLALALLVIPATLAAQSTQPALPNSVDVLILPPTGDEATVAPIAVRNTVISATQNCNLTASPAGGTTPLVNPTIAEFDDPYTAGRVCRVPLPTGLPDGVGYRGVAVFIANTCTVDGQTQTNCRSPRSAVGIPPFQRQSDPDPACGPDQSGHSAVELAVGDWTRSVPVTGNGRVTYSLLGSRNPVTMVIVKFDGVEQDRLTGSDLRKVAGSYFYVGLRRGSFMLTVEARDSSGCSDGATRPMTVNVQ